MCCPLCARLGGQDRAGGWREGWLCPDWHMRCDPSSQAAHGTARLSSARFTLLLSWAFPAVLGIGAGRETAAPRGSAQARVERSCGQGRKAAPTAGPFQTLRAPGRAVLGAAGGPCGDLPAGASCLCRVREAPSHPSGHLSCLRFLLWSEPLQSIPESFGGSFSSPGLWAAEPVPPGRDMRESRGGRV